jgi:heme exporter protein D
MPAVINSAPDCVVSRAGSVKGDVDDFVLQSAYEKCKGFGTFMPGSTYGDEGEKAATLYYLLTWLGIAVMVVVLVGFVVVEHRRLLGHVARLRARESEGMAET